MKKLSITLILLTFIIGIFLSGCNTQNNTNIVDNPDIQEINSKVHQFISLTDSSGVDEFLLNQEKQVNYLSGIWKETWIKNNQEFSEFINTGKEIENISKQCGAESLAQSFRTQASSYKIEVKNIKISDTQIENDFAYVDVTYDYNGEKVSTKFKLQKINGTWFVLDRTKGSLGGIWITSMMEEDTGKSSMQLFTEQLQKDLSELKKSCGMTTNTETDFSCNNDLIEEIKISLNLEDAPHIFSAKDSWGDNIAEWDKHTYRFSEKLNNNDWEVTFINKQYEEEKTQISYDSEKANENEFYSSLFFSMNLDLSENSLTEEPEFVSGFKENLMTSEYEIYKFEDNPDAKTNFDKMYEQDKSQKNTKTRVNDEFSIGDESYIYHIDESDYSFNDKENIDDYDRYVINYRINNIIVQIVTIDEPNAKSDLNYAKELAGTVFANLCK